jgi:hypothetical protein
MKKDFVYFMKCLIKAGEKIERHYFQIAVADLEKPIFRERVYCYELYHQLRNILKKTFPYKLDGEMDKNGQPLFRNELEAKKPDFIVHVPGEMGRNLVIIEVKPIIVKDKINELRKDIETLKNFLNKAHYYRAIMLLYGNGESDLPQNIQDEITNLPMEYRERIVFVWHRGPGEKPMVI